MNRDALKASLLLHEGKKATGYLDSLGVGTIGVGHSLKRPISDTAINQILSDDMEDAVSELDRAFTGWRNHSEARQTVLAELIFNLGAPRLSTFFKFWGAMRIKDYPEAAAQLLDSEWAKQVKPERSENLAKRLREDLLA